MTPPAIECGIALGSNCGDRLANLRAAIAALRARDPRLEVSPVYETAPVDCPEGSGAFYNAVALLAWTETPEDLLDFLRGIESSLGRPADRTRNAPRGIDLDILYAGDTVRDDQRLALPHPRLHLRPFVLQPLCDLRPDLVLPGFRKSISGLLANLSSSGPAPAKQAVDL